jgi:two-component system CheB/CheR fusion protein
MNGKYLFANRRFQSYFQIGDDYVGKSDFDLLPPKLAADLWGLDMQALREQSLVTGEHLLEASGGPHYLRSAHQVLLDGDGKPMSFIVEAEDITDRKNAEEQMRIAAKVFEQTADAILVSNSAGIIQTVNSAFTAITGYTQQEIVGASVDILKSDRHDNDFYEQQTKALGASGFWQGEVWSARKGGEVFPEWRTINRIDNQFGTVEHYVSVFSDISQIKASQHKVEYLATHDALTGLPNRALFQDRLRHALAQARRTHIRLALLFIDLDNFKTVNDTFGHDIGDEILIEASSRLHVAMRDVDSVCRFGGDEFTVLLVDCSVEAADGVARRIVDDLSRSYEISGQKLLELR